MSEEPEQVLEKDRTAAAVFQVLAELDHGRMKKLVPRSLSNSIITAPTNNAGKPATP